MRRLIIAAALAATTVAGGAPRTTLAAEPAPLDPALQQAIDRVQRSTTSRGGTPMVAIELLVSDTARAIDAVVAAGGVVTGTVPGHIVQARVPGSRAAEVARSTAISFARLPRRSSPTQIPPTRQFGPTTGEQVAKLGAAPWHAASVTGNGVRVGIIDFFDTSLWNPSEHGPVPSVANGRMFCQDTSGILPLWCTAPSGGSIDDSLGSRHGIAVAEIIKDMAPGAEIFIATAGTVSDERAAIDFFANNGVTIISRSLIYPYDGAGDGSGPSASLVDYAASKNMVWFNAAGNEADDMYMRFRVSDNDGDRVMEFGNETDGDPGAADEFLRLDSWSGPGGCVVVDGVRWSNDWYLPDGQLTDYRVEVFQPQGSAGGAHDNPPVTPVDLTGAPGVQYFIDVNQRSVANPNKVGLNLDPLEMSGGFWCTASGASYLRIVRDSATPVGATDTIEVALSSGWLELDYGDAAGSASKTTVDSKSQNMISVGAIDPPLGTSIASYSSQGPTIDGRRKPEVSAPSCVLSTVYAPDCFNGTSAATPVVAGFAALLLDHNLAAPGQGLAGLVKHLVTDRGIPGPDNVFGAGEVTLPAVPPPPPAPAPTVYNALNPTRIFGPGSPILQPGGIIDLTVLGQGGLPSSGVSAVALNVASVGSVKEGFMQVVPHLQAPVGATSNMNVSTAGSPRSNFVIVPVGVDGKISIFLETGGTAYVDVLGYFSPAPSANPTAGRFVPIASERWVATVDPNRLPVGFSAPRLVNAGETVQIPILPGTAIPMNEASALVVTVTSAASTANGWLRAIPTGGVSGVATVNFLAGVPAGNTSIVQLGAGNTISVYVSQPTRVYVDVVGYITNAAAPPSSAGRFVPLPPGRTYASPFQGGIFAAGETRPIQISGLASPAPAVPTGALAISANVAVVRPLGTGYLQAYANVIPPTSTMNYGANKTVATGVITSLNAAGVTNMFVTQSAHVYIDPNGYFTAASP